MLNVNSEWMAANSARAKRPIFVVEQAFDTANTDLHYFTSHSDAELPVGASRTLGVVDGISHSSQRLRPDEGRAEIGSITVRLLDVDGAISSLLDTKDASGESLAERRTRVYVGYPGLDWDDYEIIPGGTQIVDDLQYSEGVYTLRCADVQRLERKEIFTLQSTNLRDTVDADDTTIPVFDTTGFEGVEHSSAWSDGPSETVVYINLDDEIIRCPTSGITADSFTNVVRGRLGSKAAPHEITAGEENDRQPEVKEYVYLEGPLVKIAYAILTGSLYGQGSSLPTNWHLGIDGDFIDTSSFVNIDRTWWDTSNDGLGIQGYFVGLEDEDGKRFVEREILLQLGAFTAVKSTGELSLKKRSRISSDASTGLELGDHNVKSVAALHYDYGSIINQIRIRWNWDDQREEYTRSNVLIDSDSITKYKDAPIKDLAFRGMFGNAYTDQLLGERFDALRSAYSGPPLRTTVRCLPSTNLGEVGDVVRLNVSTVRDFAGQVTSIDRAVEIQSARVDWMTGEVTYEVMGSTEEPSLITRDTSATYLPDSFYTSEGTALTTAISSANYTLTGDSLEINGDCTLTGASDLSSSSAIYYHDGPVTIASGTTVTITDNIQLRVKGFLTIEGTIDGAGQGLSGVSPTGGDGGDPATTGFFGTNRGGAGADLRLFFEGEFPASLSQNGVSSLDSVGIAYDGTSLSVPEDLRGVPGGAGANIYNSFDPGISLADGGTGGSGGAGIIVVCRGASSTGGTIDTSGTAGTDGGDYQFGANINYAGAGAGGCPGAVVIATDGNVSTPTVSITAERAATAIQDDTTANRGTQNQSCSTSALKIIRLIGEQSPSEDVPEATDNPTAVSATEQTDTPRTLAGNISSIEVSVTDPSASNYSYSNIYYRISGAGDPWELSGPVDTNGEWVISPIVSDGTTYEIQARGVSQSGVENPSGPTTTITVSNVESPTIDDTSVETIIVPPKPTGLEIEGQGNSTEWEGAELTIRWNETSITKDYEFGDEPDGLGAGAGAIDQYLDGWVVRVLDGNTELHSTIVREPRFVYTREQNRLDYVRENDARGGYRSLTIDVRTRTRTNSESDPARITVNNPAEPAPANVQATPDLSSVTITRNNPTEPDHDRTLAWISTSPGFTRDGDTLAFNGDGDVTITGLSSNTTYYGAIAHADTFVPPDQVTDAGLSVTTFQFTTTASITSDEVSGLSTWATRLTDVDKTFIEANMSPNAIPSERIETLVAGKIAAGTMAAEVALAGVFVATASDSVFNQDSVSAGTWRLDTGPVTDGGTTYIQRFHDGSGNSTYSLDSNGNASFSGTVTITGGSGIASLSDAGSLATQDAVTYRQATEPSSPIEGDIWHNTSSSTVSGVPSQTDARWNGTTWDVTTDSTNRTLTLGTTITGGGIQLSSGGAVYSNGMSDETPIAGGGVWVGYNSTSTKYTFGVGDTTNAITYDGTDLLAKTLKTSSGSGERIELNPAGDNNLYFYNSSGNERIRLGTGTDTYAFYIRAGSFGDSIVGLIGKSSYYGVIGQTDDTHTSVGAGVLAEGTGNSPALLCRSYGTDGVPVVIRDEATNQESHILFNKPSKNSSDPTHNPSINAAFYVKDDGDPFWNKGNTTTWNPFNLVAQSTSSSETDFPIGTVLVAYTAGTTYDRNEAVTLNLSAGNTYEYSRGGAGTQLSGTWRARGRVDTSDNVFMFQRVS